ncbi:efflux RND transporter periplasmic adaptor subunit [Bradyrhizobium sp. cf659]|uniref:efflux RND transporter periplasmic adaptor subunit n=1 Tax=Bradyrhizobium sp. cf659 TaxID=1761771 RepID=UPI0008E89FC2|nr:efflux RND transporter periplasmic adaptor subunit [Bradyrhizobium sp. cf659]SFI60330.1 RND family efflux transporter, MFP subunit [Bradyrhizobium sp. cf659]
MTGCTTNIAGWSSCWNEASGCNQGENVTAGTLRRGRRWFVRPHRLGAGIFLLYTISAAAPSTAQQAKADDQFECLVQPKMVLKLGTPVPGLITEVLVDRGAILKKGDVVARIESSVEAAAVALAKARAENDSAVRSGAAKFEFQKRKEERTRLLRRNDTVSAAAADEAETSARVAEIDLEEAKINLQLAQLELARAGELLRQRTIRSPIDGIVVARMLGPGEYAFDQAQLVTISQVDPLNVEVFVPLSQFGKIRSGMVAEVYLEEPIGGRYAAKVTIVDQVFDAASGTIGIRLELPNPDYALPAGLKCRVRFSGLG